MGKNCMEMSEKFYLKDKIGSILVDLKNAEVDVEPAFSCDSDEIPRKASEAIRQKERDSDSFFGIKTSGRTYTEYLIRPGDKVFVLGTVSSKGNFPPRHTESMILCQGENDPLFYVSDKPVKKNLARLGWKTITGIFGGAALAVLCIILSIAAFFF